MQVLRRSRRQFRFGFLGAILIATLAIAGVSAAFGASGESASHSTGHVRKQAHLQKQKKAQHRKKKKAQHRKHKKAQARENHRNREDGSKANGPVELAPGVTESPNGWIHYEPLPAGPSVQSEETARFNGTPIDGGAGCSFEKPSTMPLDGRELIREEIAYNPDTCEAVYLERLIGDAPLPGDGIGLSPDGVQLRVVPGDPGTVDYRSGHNMQLWVDPLGITITGLNLDLRWPLDGASGEWALDPWAYKYSLDGWRAGLIQKDLIKAKTEKELTDEKLWADRKLSPNAPAGGYRGTAYRRFENIDFYKAVKAAKFSWVCDNVKTEWTIFEHEVAVTGYHNGKMGTWDHSSKSGPCEDLVHGRERVGWYAKGDNFPKEFRDEPANKAWRATHAGRVLASLASADRVVVSTGTNPVPWDLAPIDVKQTSVQLEGGVNPRGKSTNWWVQCGPTEAYEGWVSGQVNIGSGTTAVPFTVTVPNLQANTTYHCRTVALNTQGEASFGPDLEFTTAPYVPDVATAYATDITNTSAKLTGWVNPNGSATNYYFQYGTTGSYGSTIPAPPGWSVGSGNSAGFTWNDIAGLAPGTTYHYRVVASNASGTTYGEDTTFITTGGPPIVTTGPAEELTTDQATLTGSVNPNGLPTNYYFEYGRTAEYDYRYPWYAPPGEDAGSGNTSASIKRKIYNGSLEIGATYHYRFVASNAAGTTYGEDRTFTMLTWPPGARTDPAIEVKDVSAYLRGTVWPNKATSFYFDFGKTTAYGAKYPQNPEPIGEIGPRSVEYQFWNLEPGVTYHYRVVASNYSGTTYGKDQTFTTTTPSTPRVEPTMAGEVTPSKVVMASKVDVKSLAGTYYFEYGNLENYGSKTETKAVPSGAGYQQVSSALEGLPVGATVHYRVVVTNSDRTVQGPDQVATTGWTNEPSTGPKNSKGDRLLEVSCPSAGNCVAVGYLENSTTGARVATASRWNGTSWTPIEPTVAAAWTVSELKGVSCTSTTNCMAVGYGTNAGVGRPLTMKWNGTAWSEVSAGSGLPAGYNVLNDVDCPAANSCEAVGLTGPTSGALRALAMHWDGSAWTVRASANPVWPGSEATKEDVFLLGVSCASTTFCKAVGTEQTVLSGKSFPRPVIERLNGSEWLGETPDVNNWAALGYNILSLSDVACPTTTTCVAVGSAAEPPSTYMRDPERANVMRWNGTKWSAEITPNVYETSKDLGLYAISCPSATSCRATDKAGRGMRWTGKEWKLQVAQLPTNALQPASAMGISCPTVAECHSVGSYVSSAGPTVRLTQGWSGASTVPKTLSDAATSVTETSATLRGFVDPAGVDSKAYFEWGPTTSYGSKTAETGVGSGGMDYNSGAWVAVSAGISSLVPGVNYHYRVAVTNGITTSYGPDTVFEALNKMNAIPVTEPFNGETSVISDFATKWAPLQWTGAGHKGNNNGNGYGPVDTAANGAYFMPSIVADATYGSAAKATLESAPGVGGRIALWLDMANPATAKSGYQLVFQETSTDVYTVTLKRWLNGVETSLASKTGYSFPVGSAMAISDRGNTVEAWGKVDGNFVKILGVGDSAYSAGNAGIEVSGASTTRLFNFGAGNMVSGKFASFDAAVAALPVNDPLDRNESPLSLANFWGAPYWANATLKTGKTVAGSGWTSGETATSVAAAYWQKVPVGDTGTGDVVMVTTNKAIGASPNYLGLWLNAPSPSTTKSGYQLRLGEMGTNSVNMMIVRWVNGAATAVASKTFTMPNGGAGTKIALVDKGGTLSVWTSTGGAPFSQVLAGPDSTYSYGYTGIEGVGSSALRDFKQGPLYPH